MKSACVWLTNITFIRLSYPTSGKQINGYWILIDIRIRCANGFRMERSPFLLHAGLELACSSDTWSRTPETWRCWFVYCKKLAAVSGLFVSEIVIKNSTILWSVKTSKSNLEFPTALKWMLSYSSTSLLSARRPAWCHWRWYWHESSTFRNSKLIYLIWAYRWESQTGKKAKALLQCSLKRGTENMVVVNVGNSSSKWKQTSSICDVTFPVLLVQTTLLDGQGWKPFSRTHRPHCLAVLGGQWKQIGT